MNAVEITAEVFESLVSGQIVRAGFASCMASRDNLTLRVGRRSYSKKFNVHTLFLDPTDGSKPSAMERIKLYMRANNRVSMAFGDMAIRVTSFEIGA